MNNPVYQLKQFEKRFSGIIFYFLKYVILALGLVFIGFYLYIFFNRIAHPFDHEWMKDASLKTVLHMITGSKAYMKSGINDASLIFTPLYYYITVFFTKLSHSGVMPLRVLSFAATLGTFVMIYFIVENETGDSFISLVASCLFCAMYKLCGAWFNTAHADSLYIVFLLLGIYFLRVKTVRYSVIYAACFFALSFFARQVVIVALPPLFLYALISNRKKGLIFTGLTILLVMGVIFILNKFYENRFLHYVFYALGNYRMMIKTILHLFIFDIVLSVPIIAGSIAALFYIVLISKSTSFTRDELLFYVSLGTGLLLLGIASRLISETFANVSLPIYALVTIIIALFYKKTAVLRLPGTLHKRVRICLLIALIIQLSILLYKPSVSHPGDYDRMAGSKIVAVEVIQKDTAG